MTNLVADLIAYDVVPPNDDYSPLEFGERLGRDIPANQAKQVVVECWKALPGSLAESFLEGFIETARIEGLPSLLLGCLSSTFEITSVGSIVQLLRSECHLEKRTITQHAVNELGRTSDIDEQNRLAYAIQCTGGCLGSEAAKVAELLASGCLSDYAKFCLDDLYRRDSVCDTGE